MKLFDKIKDLFTDDVDESDEFEIKDIKIQEEKKLPTIMRTEKVKEEIKIEDNDKSVVSDRELFKETASVETSSSNNFRFPIAFENNDFTEEKIYSSQNVMRQEKEQPKRSKESYSISKVKKEEAKPITLFKASPVISPVYGILDKNYKKEELHTKDKKNYEINRNSSSKKVDFESVRKKAFGSLADDIKDNLSDNRETKGKLEEENEELLHDMITDSTDISEITIGDAEENYFDFGVAYENAKEDDKNLKKEKDEVKIVSFDNNPVSIEKVNVEEPIIDRSKQDEELTENDKKTMSKENLELSDDIFNLIDNMYQEKGDDEND